MGVDAYIEKVIKSVEDATGKFNGALPAIERRMLDEIVVLLKDLRLKGGRIASSTENLKVINKIHKRLEKLVLSKDYVKDLAEFVRSYDAIASHHLSFYGKFSEFKPSAYYDMVKTTAMRNTIDALMEVGVRANVLQPLRGMLLTAVTSGQSYASLSETLRKELIGGDGVSGSLSRYASTYAVTAVSDFSGQYLSAINAGMGFKWYVYRGSNLTTTREFCRYMTKKEYIHESEFSTVLSGDIDGHQCAIYKKKDDNKGTDLPYGLKAGTTPENFVANRGGWNCGHGLYPVPDGAVPKEVRERLEKKMNFEKTLESYENKDISTLKNTHKLVEQWIKDNASNYPELYEPGKAEEMKKIMLELFENSDFGMMIGGQRYDNVDVLNKILKSHFKNQLETNTSGGMLEQNRRKNASQDLFGTDIKNTRNEDFEKYGFLMDRDILKQANNNNLTDQYGNIAVRFRKDKVVTTFTMMDSLESGLSPSLTTDPKISSFGEQNSMFGDFNKAKTYTRSAVDFTNRYAGMFVELQFHGHLDANAIESIFIPNYYEGRLDMKLLNQYKGKIKFYTTDENGNLKTLL